MDTLFGVQDVANIPVLQVASANDPVRFKAVKSHLRMIPESLELSAVYATTLEPSPNIHTSCT